MFHVQLPFGGRLSDPPVKHICILKVVPGPADKPMMLVHYKGEEKQISAEGVSSLVLPEMKRITEANLDYTVNYVLM